jgi:diadenosine tetraphosphate (Ap4A) HIT family hydrolase
VSCLFCNMDWCRVILERDLAFVIYDGFPVTEYHCLIIPKRHAEMYFDLTEDERNACHRLLVEMKGRSLKILFSKTR